MAAAIVEDTSRAPAKPEFIKVGPHVGKPRNIGIHLRDRVCAPRRTRIVK